MKRFFIILLIFEKKFSHETRISMKAKVKNGTIAMGQLFESLPDEDSKAIDNIAQDIMKASSYLLNMFCKNTDVSNKDCVKFMSKYSLPEFSSLGKKCLSDGSKKYLAYRRILPATYKDGIHKVCIMRNANATITLFFFIRFVIQFLEKTFLYLVLSQMFCSHLVWKTSNDRTTTS